MSTGGRGGEGLHTHHLTDCCEYVYWREGRGYTHITLQTAVSMSTGGRGGEGLHAHHLTDCCEYVYWREGRGGVTHTSPYRLL